MEVKNFLITVTPGILKPFWARLEASPLGHRLARGAFWSLVGGIVARLFPLVAFIFVARALGKEAFGELGTVQSTVALFGVAAGFGVGATATKYVAEYRQRDADRARRIITLSMVVAWITSGGAALVLWLLSPWLAQRTLAAPHLGGTLQIGTLILLLNGINGAQVGVLVGFESFKQIAVVNCTSGVLSFPMLVAGAYWYGLEGAVWALAISTLATCVLTQGALRREAARAGIPPRSYGWTKEWPVLWRYSLPTLLAGFIASPVLWACNAILVNQRNGYLEMGLFNAANLWRQVVLIVPSMVGVVGFPMLANLLAENNFASFRKVLRANVAFSVGVAAVIAVPVALCAPFIMRAYGSSFVGGQTILLMLCVVGVITAALNVVGQSIASEGRMWFGFLLNGVWAIALLGASLLLIPSRGAFGMALANLIAYGVHLLTVSLYVFFRLRAEYRANRCHL